jgi:uncharacterized membrane protein YphA (DoxX/SURF4 family)
MKNAPPHNIMALWQSSKSSISFFSRKTTKELKNMQATAGVNKQLPSWAKPAFLHQFAGVCHSVVSFFSLHGAPLLDLLIRLWLARCFWASGILKLTDWERAIYLATYEYPVAWMAPFYAAVLGVVIEITGAALIALGLATRPAALMLLILSLIIQFEYIEVEQNLFWALLFGWFMSHGAGRFSLDAVLARGFGYSALPFSISIDRAYRFADRYLSVGYPPAHADLDGRGLF